MLLLPQVYLAARLQLVRPWPEANGKEQSLVTNVRSLGCSENPLETQEHYSFLHQEPCSLGIGMISRPETLLLVFELMRKRTTFCLWAFMWHQSCSHLFSHGNLARATVVSSHKKRKVFVVAAFQKSHVTSVRCEGPLYCGVLRNLSG